MGKTQSQIKFLINNYSAQHSTPTMKSIALLVVLVLAVCQIDAYPQPIFFPGGSGAGFGGGNAGLFGASSYGGGISNAYNGGLSSGYGNGFGSTSPFGFNAGGNGNSFSLGR